MMRLPVLGIMTAMAFGAAAMGASAQQGDAPLTPERDFSGVWTTYRDPYADPAPGRRPDSPPENRRSPRKASAARPRYDKLVGERQAPGGSLGGDNPAAHCVPYGMPTMMQSAGGYPIEFIMRPEQLTMIYEVESETRRVYMPGHGMPPEKRLPVRQGYSEGQWDGDTLVVTTTDLSDGLDQRTYPHSEEATIVERFHMVPDARSGRSSSTS